MILAPLVSVIIPTFNRAATITRAIDSVLKQSYSCFELIIIDDGSTDATLEILKKYEHIEKMKFFFQENLGVSVARNRGIDMATGEYICFLDSDDEWLENKLKTQIHYLQLYPKSVCIHSNEIWIRNGSRVNQMKKHKKGGGKQFQPCLNLCLISPSTVFLKANILVELGGFRENFPVCEDYDLWLKLTSLYEIGYIDEPLIIKHGGHDDQLSRKYFGMDYYRILSIDWVLNHRDLLSDDREFAISTLIRKCHILIRGYLKHNNLKNLKEVQRILTKWQMLSKP